MSKERALLEASTNPDNGKAGWWLVEGLRHSAWAKASSANEAIEKAHDANIVDASWEYPTAKFVYEELPDVIGA